MRRRGLLQLGIASAVVLAAGGGALALLQPGVAEARLSPAGRDVFEAVGRGVLEGTLSDAAAERAQALRGLLDRIDALVAGLPPHAQAELSQLLAILAAAPGRRLLADLAPAWREASTADVQLALQSMRMSSNTLRQQAYHALHDIVSGAYFSDAGTWGVLGYPGPVPV